MSKYISEDTLKRLVSDFGNDVLRMCSLYLKDYQLAEDITRETFLRVYEKYYTFENRSTEKTWIMKIAINLCKNHMRTHWYEDIKPGILPEIKAEDIYEKLLDKNAISVEIMKLSPKYREVILLYYYQQLSVKEIAAILNKKETTILQWLKRAREQLKPLLQEVL